MRNTIKNIWREFNEFALRGSFVEIAIGIFVGAGFTPVATSLVKDIVMPLFSFVFGNVDMGDKFLVLKQGSPGAPYITLQAAHQAGALVVSYGIFINTCITFLTISWVAFWMVKAINKAKRLVNTQETALQNQTAKTTQECPECLSTIPLKARRCAHCTSPITSH